MFGIVFVLLFLYDRFSNENELNTSNLYVLYILYINVLNKYKNNPAYDLVLTKFPELHF